MATQFIGTATLVVKNFNENHQTQAYFSLAEHSFFGFLSNVEDSRGIVSRLGNDSFTIYWYMEGIIGRVHFKVSIVNGNNERVYSIDHLHDFNGHCGYVSTTLLSRQRLLDNSHTYLVDGKLILFCEAKVIDTQLDFCSNLENLSFDFQKLLFNDQYSDIILNVGVEGKKIFLHRNILVVRSPFFLSFVEKECENILDKEFKVVDISVDVFDEFVRFIYTGKIQCLERYAMDLLQLADKYQLDLLKNLCEHHLSCKLTIETVVSFLISADNFHATNLKYCCCNFIVKFLDKVKDTDGWRMLSSSKPELLSDLFKHLASKIFTHPDEEY